MNILYITAKRRFDLALGNYLRNYARVFFVASDPLDHLFFKINGEDPVRAWHEIAQIARKSPKSSLSVERYLDYVECYRLEKNQERRNKIKNLFTAYTILLENLFSELDISVCLAHERDFIDTASAQCVAEHRGCRIFYFSSGFFRGQTISVAPERILFNDYHAWEKRIETGPSSLSGQNAAHPGKTAGALPFKEAGHIKPRKIPRHKEYATRLICMARPGCREPAGLLRPRRNILSSLRHQALKKSARRLKPDNVSIQEPFILVPLQGNEILGQVENPLGIRDMEHFSEVVIRAVHKLNQQYGTRFLPVLKEHPLRPFVISDQFIKAHPEAIFLRKYDMDSLMKRTSLIVTFNSLSGFEALQLDKPVVMLGPLFYRLKGLVHCPETIKQIPQAMHHAINTPVDKAKLERLLSYLKTRYEVKANKKALDSKGLYNIASRILG